MKEGLKGLSEITVTPENTALSVGSGNLEVFATPHMIAQMEKASFESVLPFLEAGQSTVGTYMEASHISATPVGFKIRTESELILIEGRKLVFSVKSYDESGLIGEGRHERYIVDSERFMGRCKTKRGL